MVYTPPESTNIDSSFEILADPAPATTPAVVVEFNGTDIHSITGPVPIVSLSSQINLNGNGLPDSTTHNIELKGKIVRTGPGQPVTFPFANISGILGGIRDLKKLFRDSGSGMFKIKCGTDLPMYEASGVVVTAFSISETSNNWTGSADYSVSLQHETALTDDPNEQVKERNESWSVEQMEDTSYTNLTANVKIRGEPLNPYGEVWGNGVGSSSTVKPLSIITIPQFRITRRLSAKGLRVAATGTAAQAYDLGTNSFHKAKVWVHNRIARGFSGLKGFQSATKGPNQQFGDSPTIETGDSSGFKKTHLFNHTRSTTMDVANASYEVNDSWLSLPVGLPYTETYSIELSTAEGHTRTVRVQGNIVGLVYEDPTIQSGASAILPITLPAIPQPFTEETSTQNQNIDVTYSLKNGAKGTVTYAGLDQVPVTDEDLQEQTKYQNALTGWIKHIKPYLYRRACYGMHQLDRATEYLPIANTSTVISRATGSDKGQGFPNNPVYSAERLLNIIPVSTSEGHDPRKGTISYTHEFNNVHNLMGNNDGSNGNGVISENINITNDSPTDTISETQVIGRALGPILSKTGRSSARKTISVDIVVRPPININGFFQTNPLCPVWTGGAIYGKIENLIEGNKPFGIADPNIFVNLAPEKNRLGIAFVTSDQTTWSPTTGRYSRSVSWTYQPCSLTIDHRNH